MPNKTNRNGLTLTEKREMLLKLFAFANKDEEVHINLGQKTLNLFIGLSIAVVGGILVLNKDVSDIVIKSSSFVIGGVLIRANSEYAISCFLSNYRRQLEAIAKRAKVEDLLDMNSQSFYGKNYWKKHGLILQRYLNDRKHYESADDFVDDRNNKGYAVYVKKVFGMFKLVGYILIGLGIYLLASLEVVKSIFQNVLAVCSK